MRIPPPASLLSAFSPSTLVYTLRYSVAIRVLVYVTGYMGVGSFIPRVSFALICGLNGALCHRSQSHFANIMSSALHTDIIAGSTVEGGKGVTILSHPLSTRSLSYPHSAPRQTSS
jgi:hypothetical protein